MDKTIIGKIRQMKQYYYPTRECSLFLLPDGLMFGTDKMLDHVKSLIIYGQNPSIFQPFHRLLQDMNT